MILLGHTPKGSRVKNGFCPLHQIVNQAIFSEINLKTSHKELTKQGQRTSRFAAVHPTVLCL